MNFYTGCLVGVVVVSAFLFLFAKFGGAWKDQYEMNLELRQYWKRKEDHDHEQAVALSRIADAVTTWEQRYTRKKKATKPEEAS